MRGKGFHLPVDVAVDSESLVYVLSRSCSYKEQVPRITVTSLDEQTCREIGRFGTEPGCLFEPTAMVIDGRDRIYVADEHLHTVTVFDADGTLVGRWGEHGAGPGQLDRPSGLAIDPDGDLLVVDHVNGRVQRFTVDGGYLSSFGRPGTGEGEFDLPWGVAAASGGDIWVADWRNDRVHRFDAGGRHLGTCGVGLLLRPAGVAVAADGSVYVADWGNDCVRVLDNCGRLVETLLGDATLSRWAEEHLDTFPSVRAMRLAADRFEEEKRFRHPTGLTITPDGLVLVADTGRHRVQVYRRAGQQSMSTPVTKATS
ncbi:MAG: NHL repeat-containing protein [Haloechinothrix sp.]